VLFELNMEALPPLASRTNSYQPLPLFPRVAQDFSVLLDEKVSWAEVQSALEKSVIDLTFVEEYRGKQIPEGKKSLTFTVTFGSDKGTLTSQEIEEKMGSINKKLQKLGGELRI
jgi:phenylalanyl-tRNA synthetase beta chain